MNTEGCGYDGGDCCQASPAEGWDSFCSECECKETQAPNPPAPNPPAPNPPPSGDCATMPTWMNSDRIVGGEAAPSPIPWQVSIRQGTWHFCGGTILDEQTVMCAAHCFTV